MTRASTIEVDVTEGPPADLPAWDDLAGASGNVVQSSLYDASQDFFATRPVYFAAREGLRLCGGVKVYRSENRRLPAVTSRLTLGFTQFGETLLPVAEPWRAAVRNAIDAAVARYLRRVGAVSFRAVGLYGGLDALISVPIPPRTTWRFDVAWVDLSLSLDDLWARMHKSHRAEVRKAERSELRFAREDGIGRFLGLVDETYRDQEMHGPDRAYVQHFYEALGGAAELFFVARGPEYLAGALCVSWGGVAYWHFGGTTRQGLGAGAYLQWQVMKYYKERGVRRYVLGQVSAGNERSNPRFTVGITRFKRHFGPEETASESRLHVLRSRHHRVWTTLSAWAKRYRGLTTWTTPR